jgi:hypothetical protein
VDSEALWDSIAVVYVQVEALSVSSELLVESLSGKALRGSFELNLKSVFWIQSLTGTLAFEHSLNLPIFHIQFYSIYTRIVCFVCVRQQKSVL